MFYPAARRPLHSNLNDSSPRPRTNQRSGSVSPTQFMPRYHYSRTAPNTSEATLIDTHSNGFASKPAMTTAATSNNYNPYSSFTSTFIPFVTNNRTITPTVREFIQIPVNREDGPATESTNLSRSVPITFITETGASPPLEGNNTTKATFTNLLRPSSRYFQHHFINNDAEEPTGNFSTVARVPSATRRLSLSVPVVTSTTGTDNDTTHSRIIVSPIRQIPVRFPQSATTASTPNSNSRMSSAILRSSPLSSSLQRRRTDLGDISQVNINNSVLPPSSSSDFNVTSVSTLPIRRAEAMARQAIQNLTQQQQQRNNAPAESSNRSSPPPPRRLIINLRNNQSVSLDSHLSAAMKLPPLPTSPRSNSNQRNNVYHIPVLHELQMPPHPSAVLSESAFQLPSANNGSYKNELRMEIPVTITTGNDQENESQPNYVKEDGFSNGERFRPHNPRQTLKSILKRSSSRETVSRKNVSFMNA